MTTPITLPQPPREVPPVRADPAGVADYAADLLAASAQLDDVGGFVAGPARLADWDGVAAAAYAAAVRATGRHADALSLALREAGRRVDQHAEALRRLAVRRGRLVDGRSELGRWIHTLALQARSVPPELAGALQEESEACGRAARALDADVDAWRADLGAEEQAVVAALAGLLGRDRLVRHYAAVPDPADAALAAAPPAGTDPAGVHAWWSGLDRVAQLAVIAAAPGLVGNRGGIPAGDRDAANTIALHRDLATWGALEAAGSLTNDERRRLAVARALVTARAEVREGHDPVTAQPLRTQLYLYEPGAFGGDGAVALAAGDLATADDVAVLVPGFGTDATRVPEGATRVAHLYDVARTLDGSRSTASMIWIGYDAPDSLPWTGGWDAAGVGAEAMAARGGARLADAVDGLRAADGPAGTGRAHLTVIGHSYGSTTTGRAAHDHGLAADDLVVVGSPGLGGDTDGVADLGLPAGHVWVGANSRDPVARLGNDGAVHLEVLGGAGLGDDPAEDDFGAVRFQAESTTRVRAGVGLADHSKYFDTGTESLHEIGQVVTGHHDRVRRAAPVVDPWYAAPLDPEASRTPTAPRTTKEP